MTSSPALAERPQPPQEFWDSLASFAPAPYVERWIRATFLDSASPLYNAEHDHLQQATIGVLWTSVPNARHMVAIAATAEMPYFQGGRWAKARQEQQFFEWFGLVPDFVLTFDAHFAAKCPDATWCALVEHELYHCGQAVNEFGGPKFRRDGTPVFSIRGHDSEEFIGIVRRYGAGAAAGKTAQLIAAAALPPAIASVDIAAMCGACG